jgi:hypothetical protein
VRLSFAAKPGGIVTLISPSAWPANVASLDLSVSGAFDVKSQPLAFSHVVGINAC